MPTIPKQTSRAREARAWELRQRGWSLARIAAELGSDPSAVGLILRRAGRRLSASLAERADAVRADQTAQLEYLAMQAMDAWERSKADAVTVETVEKERPGAGGAGDEPSGLAVVRRRTLRRSQTGDPRHLDVAMRALAEIRKIWGIGAPRQADPTPARPRIEIIEVCRPIDGRGESDDLTAGRPDEGTSRWAELRSAASDPAAECNGHPVGCDGAGGDGSDRGGPEAPRPSGPHRLCPRAGMSHAPRLRTPSIEQ